MSRASGCSDMPQRNRNNLPHLLGAIAVKLSVRDGKISNQTTMGKRSGRFGEARIVDETKGFGLDFLKKTESGYWRATPDVEAVL